MAGTDEQRRIYRTVICIRSKVKEVVVWMKHGCLTWEKEITS